MSRRKRSRLADDRRLTALERRKLGARTYEPGTCVFCGRRLGKFHEYDDLFCSYECTRWYARAAHGNGYRFADVDERGGEPEVVRSHIAWLKENPGDTPEAQDYRKDFALRLESILADLEEGATRQ